MSTSPGPRPVTQLSWRGVLLPLELEFARAVDAIMAAIARFPDGFAPVEGDMRPAVLRRFPYQLIYFRDGDTIVIVSCWYHRRRPTNWRSPR